MRRLALAWGLCFVSLLIGCGGEYAAEKLFWKGEQSKKAIYEHKDAAPAGLYQKARESYQAVLDQYPTSKKAAEAQVSIGEIHSLEGKYTEAEDAFIKTISLYANNAAITARAKFSLARVKEKQKSWPQALELYRELMDKYEQSPIALRVPLYLARRYRKNKENVLAKNAYNAALRYYKRLERTYPGTQLALAAFGEHIQCLVELGRWRDAVQVLGAIEENFPGTKEAAQAGQTKEQILKGLEKNAE